MISIKLFLFSRLIASFYWLRAQLNSSPFLFVLGKNKISFPLYHSIYDSVFDALVQMRKTNRIEKKQRSKPRELMTVKGVKCPRGAATRTRNPCPRFDDDHRRRDRGRAVAIHKTRVYYSRSFDGLGKRSGPACDNARANDFIAL